MTGCVCAPCVTLPPLRSRVANLLALIPCSASAEAFLARWGGELGTDYVLLSGRLYDPLEGLLMAEQPAHGAAQTEAVRS